MDRLSKTRWALLLAAILVPSGMAWADPSPVTATGVPAQVIPTYSEPGAPTFVTPSGGSSFLGDDTSSSSSSDSSSVWGTTSTTSGSAMADMMATSYGDLASTSATEIGVNPEAVAGIGELESGFQNVATANGSSSATGPWQITAGTWADTVAEYDLPYTAADITDPAAQATVASYLAKGDATAIETATGEPATVVQTYGSWVFGSSAGSDLATANASDPLSDYVSDTALSNNNMTGWTVGQFYSTFSNKLGTSASATVLTS